LTNKPHTIFYVAVVLSDPRPEFDDFVASLRKSMAFPLAPLDDLVDLAHEDAARDYRQALMAQLRHDLGYDDSQATAEERRSFDGN
jgi:hypothetical protein